MLRRPLHPTDPGDTHGLFKFVGVLCLVALCHLFIRDGEPFRWHSRIFVTLMLVVAVYGIHHVLFEPQHPWRNGRWNPPLRPALRAIDRVATVLGYVLIIGFLSNLVLLARVWPIDPRSIELPMVDPQVAIHPDGTIVCYSTIHGRIQEYTRDGDFIGGWYVNPGKHAKMVMDEDGVAVLQGPHSRAIFRIVDREGVAWRTDAGPDAFDQTRQYTARFDGGMAGEVISRWRFPCGRVIRIHPGESETVLIESPWYLWLWAFPAYPFLLAIPVLLLDFVIKVTSGSSYR